MSLRDCPELRQKFPWSPWTDLPGYGVLDEWEANIPENLSYIVLGRI